MLNYLVIILFIFFIGSLSGWCLELVFRRFFGANNPDHRWINPGFLTGPYLPIYGFGLVSMFLMAYIPVPIENETVRKLVLFLAMAVTMTVIEYIAGLIFIKGLHIRLWDYTMRPGNIQGIICPLFSFFWAVLGAVYYFLIHPHVLQAVSWLADNMAFCLVIGFFYGIFWVDVFYSFKLVNRIKKFAEEKEIVVRYEAVKSAIRKAEVESREKLHFLFAFNPDVSLREHLERYVELMTAFHADHLPEPIRKTISHRRDNENNRKNI